MKAKTVSSKETWKAPDGQRTIWDVVLEADGKDYRLKTYSAKIAEVGFEGEVESYTNDRGDKFVKQVPKEQPAHYGGSYQPRDDAAIRAQWALGQAMQLELASFQGESKTFSWEQLERSAKQLYALVDRVKEGQA